MTAHIVFLFLFLKSPPVPQVGLPDDEIATRSAVHRGVFCRSGLLVPSDTTLYHICTAQVRPPLASSSALRPPEACSSSPRFPTARAQHFNSQLPLGGPPPSTQLYFAPDFAEKGYTQAYRVRQHAAAPRLSTGSAHAYPVCMTASRHRQRGEACRGPWPLGAGLPHNEGGRDC